VIDLRGVQRSHQRPVHHIVTFRTVFAANVLDDTNVTAFDDHVGGVVVALEIGGEVSAALASHAARIIGRARQKDRRVLCAFGHEDDGVQPDAVTHRNHDLTTNVIEAVVGRLELLWRLAGESLSLGNRGRNRERKCERCNSFHHFRTTPPLIGLKRAEPETFIAQSVSGF
jgi:hypothetical protein